MLCIDWLVLPTNIEHMNMVMENETKVSESHQPAGVPHTNAHDLHSKIGYVFQGFKFAFQGSVTNSSGQFMPNLIAHVLAWALRYHKITPNINTRTDSARDSLGSWIFTHRRVKKKKHISEVQIGSQAFGKRYPFQAS